MQSSYISLVEPDIIQHIHYLSSTYYATTVSWRHLAEHVIAKDKEACTTTPFAFNKPIWVARRASNWPGLLHHVDQKVTLISIKSNKSSRLFLKKVKIKQSTVFLFTLVSLKSTERKTLICMKWSHTNTTQTLSLQLAVLLFVQINGQWWQKYFVRFRISTKSFGITFWNKYKTNI